MQKYKTKKGKKENIVASGKKIKKTENKMGVETICPNCGKVYNPILKRPSGDDRPIQTIFPKSKAYEREQLITGICSDECWDEFLGVPKKRKKKKVD